MSYDATPIYLVNPRYSTPNIKKSIDSFLSFWLPLHSSKDSLTLFHYTTLEGLKGILHNRSVWCSHIGTFNDPLEIQYGKRAVLERLNVFLTKENETSIRRFLNSLVTEVEAFDRVLYHVYAACFCEKDNLLSQWRGYAAKGGGYNLGISFDSETRYSHSLESLAEESHLILRKIIYKPEEQNQIIEKYLSLIVQAAHGAIKNFLQQMGDIPDTWEHQTALESANILFDLIMSFKNEVFSEENEWRLIKAMVGNHRPELLKFRENNGGLIPYLNTFVFKKSKNGSLEFPLQTIKFGPALEEMSTNSSLELFLNNKASLPNPIKIEHVGIRISGAGYALR